MWKNYRYFLSAGLLIVALLLLGLTYNNLKPYRGVRGLPTIEAEEVQTITMDYFMDTDVCVAYDGSVPDVVSWYNAAKELKSDMGTTSDCRMTLDL